MEGRKEGEAEAERPQAELSVKMGLENTCVPLRLKLMSIL